MPSATDQSRHLSTTIRLEDLQLSVEEMAAVEQGLTIALTEAHLVPRGWAKTHAPALPRARPARC